MMWVFIGIEGASVMSNRARRRSEVGLATILGLVLLLALYVCASVLPSGVMGFEPAMDGDASNVTGAISPLDLILPRTQQVGALVVLDTCQSAAHLPLDFRALKATGVDAMCI